MVSVVVRAMTASDVPGVNDIANHYILTTAANLYYDAVTVADRAAWFAALGGRYRAVVATDDDTVVGYASSAPVRPRPGFDRSVETSVYVDPARTGQGLGTALYAALFEVLAGENVHRLYAVLTLPNDASVALHERFGFRQVGRCSEMGYKFGTYWDVAWFERPGSVRTTRSSAPAAR